METESSKAVVFGIGGAGCRIANKLAGSLKNTDIAAVDKDKARLESLDASIKKISVAESLTACTNFDEAKHALGPEADSLDSALTGANAVIIVAPIGGPTGSCLSEFVTQLCESKKIFSVVISLYPENRNTEAKQVIKKIQRYANGVVSVDNTVADGEGQLPVSELYERVNSKVAELVSLLVNSISGAGSMSMSKEELAHFFHGELTFKLAAGSGESLTEAADNAFGEAPASGVSRVLTLVSTPSEANLEEMRALNENISGRMSPEYVKWISGSSADGRSKVLLICGLGESATETVQPEQPQEEKAEEPSPKEENPVEEIPEKPSEEAPRMPSFLAPPSPGKGLLKSQKTYRSPALVGLNTRVVVKKQEVVEEDDTPPPSYGMTELKRALGKKVRENLDDNVDQDLDNMASELVGEPVTKKKGQKKLEEYKDDLGVGYI